MCYDARRWLLGRGCRGAPAAVISQCSRLALLILGKFRRPLIRFAVSTVPYHCARGRWGQPSFTPPCSHRHRERRCFSDTTGVGAPCLHAQLGPGVLLWVMADNNPASERHEIALQIEALRENYDSNQQNRAAHDSKTLFWARVAGIGVALYTLLTLAIVAASIYSARQAKISADAARLSAATAQHAEKQQLRAYVGINSEPIILRCDACDDPSKPIVEQQDLREDNSIITEMQNFGQTPAYDTTVYINWQINQYGTGLAEDFTYPDTVTKGLQTSKFAMYPGQKRPTVHALDAQTVGLIRRARNHELFIFYYGHIDYRDVFDEQSIVDFCFQYAPDAGPKNHFPLCHEHNGPRPKQ